jgi:hypothetical protein
MYTSTIKAKKIIDLIDVYVKRQLFDSLRSIQQQKTSRKIVEQFESKI